jgi:hypothetical protein
MTANERKIPRLPPMEKQHAFRKKGHQNYNYEAQRKKNVVPFSTEFGGEGTKNKQETCRICRPG